MSNRPARITQAEIERVIRAAKKAGAAEVVLKIGDNATVRIPLTSDKLVADTEEIVL
jgi:2-iminoacetate synthase ThiH